MSYPASRNRLLIATGLLPLPWFLAWVTAAGMFVPGYDPIMQHASELSLISGPPSLLLSVAAIGSGTAFITFAIGLLREVGWRVVFGALATAVFGLSMASNGLWPAGTPMHGLFAVGVVNLIGPALITTGSTRLSADRWVYAATIFASYAGVLYLWLNLTGNDPPELRGLTQRVFSSIYSGWAAVVAARLLWPGSDTPRPI